MPTLPSPPSPPQDQPPSPPSSPPSPSPPSPPSSLSLASPAPSPSLPWFLPTPLEIILLAVFWVTTWGIPSDDLWWHLACGRWFWEHGSIPAGDPLSVVSSGSPWIAHYWLWDVIAYRLVCVAGPGLLLWGKAVGAMVTIVLSLWIARVRGVRGVPATAVTLALAAAGVKSQFWNLRPQMVTPLGTAALTLLCVQAAEGVADRLWLAPVVMVVWVNCHGGFIFGLVTLGTFAAGQLVRLARGEQDARRRLTRLTIITLACIGACCINPYGPRHLLYPFFYMGNTALQTRITEWAATVVRSEPVVELSILALIVALATSPIRAAPEEILQLLIALHFTFVSTRNLFLFAPWVAPFLGARVDAVLGAWSAPARPPTPLTSHRSRLAFAVALACVPYFAHRAHWPYEPDFVAPTQQLAALRDLPAGVTVLNQYELGGLIMWDAWPRRPFIDGRSDLHIVSGGFAKFLHVWDLDAGWEKIFFDEYHVGAAILDKRTPLAKALTARGWTVRSAGEVFELIVAPRPRR